MTTPRLLKLAILAVKRRHRALYLVETWSAKQPRALAAAASGQGTVWKAKELLLRNIQALASYRNQARRGRRHRGAAEHLGPYAAPATEGRRRIAAGAERRGAFRARQRFAEPQRQAGQAGRDRGGV